MRYQSDVDYGELGQRLRKLREASGMSQAAAGERVGKTGAWVSAVERGISRTPIDVLEVYAETVGGRITVILLPAEDEEAALLARFGAVLPGLSLDARATLDALVALWEAHQLAGLLRERS